jgi:hypothetical protein
MKIREKIKALNDKISDIISSEVVVMDSSE